MSAVTQSTNETEQYDLPDGPGDERPISEAVVEVIATAEGVEPSALTTCLYDSIDPEALDALYKTTTDRGEQLRVSFTLAGYEVVVESERYVRIRNLDETPSS